MSEALIELYTALRGERPSSVEALPPTGSHRRYFRLHGDGGNLIGVVGTDRAENASFTGMSAHFRSKGLQVPEVLSISADGLCYLQEDLGSLSLHDALAEGRSRGFFNEDELTLLRRSVRALADLQYAGGEGLDFNSVCFQEKLFGARQITFDLNYFKYCFLKTSGVEFNEIPLQDDFERFTGALAEVSACGHFLHRDFQARNILIRDGRPWVIDFQGGMEGPVFYDLASFVWQARARYSAEIREMLIREYIDEASGFSEIDRTTFIPKLKTFALFRMLQVLGCYGFRGKYEKKQAFIEAVPYAVDNLRGLLDDPDLSGFRDICPYLHRVLQELCARPEHAPAVHAVSTQASPLEIDVVSFSFRKGLPEDGSGNGGGYVFDCRGTHNPGRLPEFRELTGLDEPVIRFLENDGEISVFLDNALSMVEHHVRRFIERGFTHLSISFGCTGGQHRSVYCAERTARRLAEDFGTAVRVRLTHRERGISRCL